MCALQSPIMSTLHLAADSECPPYQAGVMRCYSMKYCPYAQRTRLVLLAKNVKHDIVNINLRNKPGWFLEKNPLGKVPTLEMDGRVLYESLVTCDYLDEVYPDPPLYPGNPWTKAQDRMMIEVWNSKVASPMNKIYYANGDKDVLGKIIKDLPDGLNLFETELTKRNTKFFAGTKPGMIDYMIWPWAERLPMVLTVLLLPGDEIAISKQQYPKLFCWMECMKEDPTVKAVYITPNTFLKFFNDRPNGIPNYDIQEVP